MFNIVNKNRFQCGKDNKNSKTFYELVNKPKDWSIHTL